MVHTKGFSPFTLLEKKLKRPKAHHDFGKKDHGLICKTP
jgi:hypothetical protein